MVNRSCGITHLAIDDDPLVAEHPSTDGRGKQSKMQISSQSLELHASAMTLFEVFVTDIAWLSFDLCQIFLRKLDLLLLFWQ